MVVAVSYVLVAALEPQGTDAKRIFQPFQRLNDRAAQDGSGLGLSIVVSIAAIHGGTAGADPRPGGGLSSPS
jgi:signal transduction histidine kinase